jgi:KDO2-lipid IV(A) lauroyltransferase
VPGATGRAAYLAYRAGADVARALPPTLGRSLARIVSRAVPALWSTRRHQVERNLQRASRGTLQGRELHQATLRVFDNYARYWHELFRLRRDNDAVESDTDSDGYEHIAVPQAAGQGVILGLPHLGNWDAAGAWLHGRGHRLTAVAEPVEPRELFEWFAEQRRAIGIDVVPLGPGAATAVLRALDDGRIAALVCDRDLTGDGVTVELFGESTTMPAGPAVLALRSGAPLVPVGIYFRPHSRRFIRIMAPVPTERQGSLRADVQRVTQDLACRFEELIAAAPDQWLMMQPVWPADVAPAARGAS